jgi:hypothetical protein
MGVREWGVGRGDHDPDRGFSGRTPRATVLS